MNYQFKRIVVAFLSAVGVIGISRANAQEARVVPARPLAESLRLLLLDGVIIPLSKPNWYRVNQTLLEAKIKGEVPSTNSIGDLIVHLREVVGPNVNVREVDAFEAVYGTQDTL